MTLESMMAAFQNRHKIAQGQSPKAGAKHAKKVGAKRAGQGFDSFIPGSVEVLVHNPDRSLQGLLDARNRARGGGRVGQASHKITNKKQLAAFGFMV